MKVLEVRIPDQLRKALEQEAARVGLAPSTYARHILLENLLRAQSAEVPQMAAQPANCEGVADADLRIWTQVKQDAGKYAPTATNTVEVQQASNYAANA